MRIASRRSVLDLLLHPISRGNWGKPNQRPLLHSTFTTLRDGRLCRLGLRIASETLSSALRPSDQVRWTVRPPYCGCQVTNATCCILLLQRGTRRVNMRRRTIGEAVQGAERKELGEKVDIAQSETDRGTDFHLESERCLRRF